MAGKFFVLTGTLSALSRDAAAEAVRRAGGNVTGSVSRKTDYVVAGAEPGGSKMDAAREYGIAVLDEARFLAMLGAPAAPPRPPPVDDLFAHAQSRKEPRR